VEESGPSLVHPHPPGAVDALPKHASDRCRLEFVIGAVPVCLERGTEAGDGVAASPCLTATATESLTVFRNSLAMH